MKVTKYEQSGFTVELADGYMIAIDIGALTPVEKLTDLSIDAMLISHLHGDHFTPEQIKTLSPKKLFLSQECIDLLTEEDKADPRLFDTEIIKIAAGETVELREETTAIVFDVDHGPNISVRPKENFGFLINADEQKLYFAGDMFYPSGIDTTNLEVDYALIPVGTFYTFGPTEAAAFIKQFKKIEEVIPMHYEKRSETKIEFEKLLDEPLVL